MRQISILGCGWLGLPLAKAFLKENFIVKGSTTSEDKVLALTKFEILPYLVTLSENCNQGNVTGFLENSEILIIAIPPKLRGNSEDNFVSKIKNFIPFIEKASVEKVLFVSSTAVYADSALNTCEITENAMPNPNTESGKQLLEVEKLLQSNNNFQTTILRFGGLIGEDRHPIHFLSGRKNLENADAPINLIHQTDCIEIIEAIIRRDCWMETFNAVAPFHPSRKEYYSQKAIALNLALPEFDERKTSIGKTILSDKVETVLGYQFKNHLG